MKDMICRQAAIKAVENLPNCYNGFSDTYDKAQIIGVLEELPSAQRKGKWLEKEVISLYENRFQLQSCKCSECDRYDTRPYIYFFSKLNFCSYCGADMRGEQDE